MAKLIFTVTNDLNYDQRMLRICSSLAKVGYEVLLVGRIRSNSKPLLEQNFQQKRLRCFFDRGKMFYLEYNIRLLFFLLLNRFDLICAIDLDTILPAHFSSKIRGKVMVYDAHEYFSQSPELIDRPRVRRIWEWIENTIIPKQKYCYTVGQGLAKIFTDKYQVPFKVIRNVPFAIVENEVEISALKSDRKVILYQGVLNEGRGLEAMINVMQLVDGAELWLAGEGDLSTKLRDLCKQLQLEDKVRFLGYLRPKELKAVTAQVTIGLNLLENKGLSYFYSLANKTFDYIQQEIPAIHMDFPEYKNINSVYEIGLLIPNLEQPVLLKAVQQLLTNETLYKQLKANCQQAKIEYTWEREAVKLTKFYAEICPLDPK